MIGWGTSWILDRRPADLLFVATLLYIISPFLDEILALDSCTIPAMLCAQTLAHCRLLLLHHIVLDRLCQTSLILRRAIRVDSDIHASVIIAEIATIIIAIILSRLSWLMTGLCRRSHLLQVLIEEKEHIAPLLKLGVGLIILPFTFQFLTYLLSFGLAHYLLPSFLFKFKSLKSYF